jgi:tRNA A-37 threonylcarbamoyl transferase component Bud32
MGRNLDPGTVLRGIYEISGVVGEGAMSVVYRARDRSRHDMPCAIKEMPRAVPEDPEYKESLAMFDREAQLLRTLDHPGLTRVFDAFDTERGHYLVMEFVEGRSLQDIFRDRMAPPGASEPIPFTPAELLPWIVQVLDILEYLHSQSPPVVFRDLKPSNIMITPQGEVKLIDFGIARLVAPQKTRDTYIMGTPGFSAPEQYGARQSNHRTDIYALGATMFYLLSGKDPESFAFAFPPLTSFNPLVPEWLSLAVSRCLERSPEKRFPSAALMKSHLLLHGAGGAAVPGAPAPLAAMTPAPSTVPPHRWFSPARSFDVDYRQWGLCFVLLFLSQTMAFCALDALMGLSAVLYFAFHVIMCTIAGVQSYLQHDRAHAWKMGAIALISGLAIAFTVTFPPPSIRYAREANVRNIMRGCSSNLKSLASALDLYSQDNRGLYPSSLSPVKASLSGGNIPTCPTAGRDTYSTGYRVSADNKVFTVCCSGLNHRGTKYYSQSGYVQVTFPDFPQYDSIKGLIE